MFRRSINSIWIIFNSICKTDDEETHVIKLDMIFHKLVIGGMGNVKENGTVTGSVVFNEYF